MGSQLRFMDVLDSDTFGLVPPCADPRFDHRTCDYWEDADRGSKAAPPAWLTASNASTAADRPAPPVSDNPFAPMARASDNPFATPPRDANPFAVGGGAASSGGPARSAALSALAGDDAEDAWNPFAQSTS